MPFPSRDGWAEAPDIGHPNWPRSHGGDWRWVVGVAGILHRENGSWL